MQTRWKRQRLAHQEATLKRVLGGVPRDVLGLLKGYLNEIDFFLLCEAFDCRVERPKDCNLLEGAIKTNRVEIVEYVLSVVKVKRSLKNMRKWTSLAARIGNVSILRFLTKHHFYISVFTTDDVCKGSGSVECYQYLVDEISCFRNTCCFGGHLDLILHAKAAVIHLFDWVVDILHAIRKNHIDLIEHVKMNVPQFLNSFFARYTLILRCERMSRSDFLAAILTYGIKVTEEDLDYSFSSNNRMDWIHEAIENHGDFFLTVDAREYLLNQIDFPERLRNFLT